MLLILINPSHSPIYSSLGPSACTTHKGNTEVEQRSVRRSIMGKGILLWLLGVPVSIIILLWLFGVLS